MTSRAICVAVLAVLPAAGCGTAANLAHTRPEEGGRVPFGGVKRDLAALQQPEAGPRTHHAPESEVYPRQSLAVLCALDLPFSFVGDVLTWPYVTVYSIVNEPVPAPAVVIADATVPVPTSAVPAVKPMSVPAAPGKLPAAPTEAPAKLGKLP